MLEQAIEGSMSHPYVLIQCRTLRIGTYKAKPAGVVFSSKGLEMKVPLPTGQKLMLHFLLLGFRTCFHIKIYPSHCSCRTKCDYKHINGGYS